MRTQKTAVRLCLTRDGRVVPEGHPDAASLLFPAGRDISDAEVRRYGLQDVTGALQVPGSKHVAEPPETKAQRGPRRRSRPTP